MRQSPSITLARTASPEMVNLAREVERLIHDLRAQPWPLVSMTVVDALKLDPATWMDCSIIVKDETGGRTVATSDGTHFRRVSNGAIIS